MGTHSLKLAINKRKGKKGLFFNFLATGITHNILSRIRLLYVGMPAESFVRAEYLMKDNVLMSSLKHSITTFSW